MIGSLINFYPLQKKLVFTTNWAAVKRIWSCKGLRSIIRQRERETWLQIQVQLLPVEPLSQSKYPFTCFLLCDMEILPILHRCWEGTIRAMKTQ